jgi:cytochrome c
MINACISKPLKGKPIDVNSTEMQSLVLYIKSIGKKSAPAY